VVDESDDEAEGEEGLKNFVATVYSTHSEGVRRQNRESITLPDQGEEDSRGRRTIRCTVRVAPVNVR
jgi:hypothetical protein